MLGVNSSLAAGCTGALWWLNPWMQVSPPGTILMSVAGDGWWVPVSEIQWLKTQTFCSVHSSGGLVHGDGLGSSSLRGLGRPCWLALLHLSPLPPNNWWGSQLNGWHLGSWEGSHLCRDLLLHCSGTASVFCVDVSPPLFLSNHTTFREVASLSVPPGNLDHDVSLYPFSNLNCCGWGHWWSWKRAGWVPHPNNRGPTASIQLMWWAVASCSCHKYAPWMGVPGKRSAVSTPRRWWLSSGATLGSQVGASKPNCLRRLIKWKGMPA